MSNKKGIEIMCRIAGGISVKSCSIPSCARTGDCFYENAQISVVIDMKNCIKNMMILLESL